MKLEELELDLQGIEDGKWLTIQGEFEVLARSYTSEKVREFLKKHRLRDGGLSLEDTGRLLAEVVILDWRGLTHEGEELKYTPEVGRKIFMDDRYGLLVQKISRRITAEDAYLIDLKEGAAKN